MKSIPPEKNQLVVGKFAAAGKHPHALFGISSKHPVLNQPHTHTKYLSSLFKNRVGLFHRVLSLLNRAIDHLIISLCRRCAGLLMRPNIRWLHGKSLISGNAGRRHIRPACAFSAHLADGRCSGHAALSRRRPRARRQTRSAASPCPAALKY